MEHRLTKVVVPEKEIPSPEDVRYVSWPNGYHIYVKIGDVDVVDDHGNQKWSNKTDAEIATKWFINNNFR